jgi:endonuclease YncB( thermonuclease family)
LRVSDGLDVNAEMVRLGHAWVFRRYTDDPALIALEEAARDARRGLWRLPAAERIPPWRWRQGNRRRTDGESGG